MFLIKKPVSIFAISGILLLSGCKDDMSEKYIGTWKNIDSSRPAKTWVIKKNGDNFIFTQQVKEYTPVITSATFKDGELVLGTGMEVILNTEGNTLSLSGDSEKFYKIGNAK